MISINRFPNEVLQKPMKRICSKLLKRNINLGAMNALEFYAREGDWQTISYADKVASLHAWEINPECEPALRKNLPKAKIRIGDSYQLAKHMEFREKFDLVILDNPQVIYGDKQQYCEHFESIELVHHLLKDKGILIFNINTSPYNYDKQAEWQKRRKAFYGIDQTEKFDFDFLKNFYVEFFKKRNFDVGFIFFEPRHDGMIYYCVVELLKQKGMSS